MLWKSVEVSSESLWFAANQRIIVPRASAEDSFLSTPYLVLMGRKKQLTKHQLVKESSAEALSRNKSNPFLHFEYLNTNCVKAY